MSTLYVSFKACLYNQPLTNASNLCIPPHSKNEDFHADIAAKPFADQRANMFARPTTRYLTGFTNTEKCMCFDCKVLTVNILTVCRRE